MTLELICEGRAIISEMEFEPRKDCEYPLEMYLLHHICIIDLILRSYTHSNTSK